MTKAKDRKVLNYGTNVGIGITAVEGLAENVQD